MLSVFSVRLRRGQAPALPMVQFALCRVRFFAMLKMICLYNLCTVPCNFIGFCKICEIGNRKNAPSDFRRGKTYFTTASHLPQFARRSGDFLLKYPLHYIGLKILFDSRNSIRAQGRFHRISRLFRRIRRLKAHPLR